VQGKIPGAAFEVLYPYDVNYPTVYGPYKLGGRLNHYVNTPTEWMTAKSGYLEGVKFEALDFGSGTRSNDLVKQVVGLAAQWGYPLRYLFAVFNGGCPWQYEMQTAELPNAKLTPWALDHVCLLGWDLTKKAVPSAQIA
jgi:hypothetical protein